jgi:NAD(P)-dependent dehydrogenase (short-subunit alcohol dehydrogenase family)
MVRGMEPLLDGKIAVVTGAAHGIGRATAALFAEHGATPVIADIDEPAAAEVVDEIVAAGGNAAAVTTDVRDDEAVARLRDHVLATYGRCDVLVNNVGHYLRVRPFDQSEPSMWQELYEINLLHVFRVTHAFLPAMLDQQRGAIVNVSSVEGARGYPPDPVYGAFKAAVIHFTKCLAVDVAGRGVRVNGVGPDLTQSQQVDYEQLDTGGRNLWPIWAPVGRRGEPEDQARAILFLASDLSDFIIGQTLLTDGGSAEAGGWFRTERREGRRWTNRPIDP